MWNIQTMPRPITGCMMTFGLGGCNVFIGVSKTDITLAHHPPPKNTIQALIEAADPSTYMMVLTPGEYVKNQNGQWELQAMEHWDSRVHVRPYNLMIPFNKPAPSVAIKEIDGNVFITNDWGKWESIQ